MKRVPVRRSVLRWSCCSAYGSLPTSGGKQGYRFSVTKIFGSIAIVAIAVAVAFNVNIKQTNPQPSIEACTG